MHSKLNYFNGHLLLSTSCVLLSSFSIFSWNFVNSQNTTTNFDLLTWEAPLVIQESFPYFLSGYDDDGVPVWAAEAGKYDIRSFLENEQTDDKLKADMMKYFEQMFERFSSPELVSRPDDDEPSKNFMIIVDMNAFQLRQLSHVPTLQTWLTWTRMFATLQQRRNNMLKAFIINSNFIFHSLWRLMQPLLGPLVNSVEIMGTNEQRWKPRILQIIPKSQLPDWLGGSKDHVPIKVYG